MEHGPISLSCGPLLRAAGKAKDVDVGKSSGNGGSSDRPHLATTVSEVSSTRAPPARKMDGRPAHVDTAQRHHGEAGSLTSLSGDEHDTLRDVLLGGFFVDGAGTSTVCYRQAQLRRLWATARAGAPRLQEVCEDAASDIAAWTRQGGALRALLVVSFGSASLGALTVLLVVVFFAAAATTNAIVCSLAVSLVAAGGFLAVLLAVLASMYVGALSVAVFIVATTTAATVIVITIATGCAAFLWMVWFVAAKCMDLLVTTTKRSMSTANSLM